LISFVFAAALFFVCALELVFFILEVVAREDLSAALEWNEDVKATIQKQVGRYQWKLAKLLLMAVAFSVMAIMAFNGFQH